ncbi:MAG TPA: rRNA maturation RNase YbeY [Sphingomicrobium sp.]|nr:rRNA maturation RNase YbeY [Sphingomicrobium sp.]
MLEIALEADEEWDSSCSWDALVERAALAAIAESAFPQLSRSPRSVELSVRLSSNEQVQALNAQWRGKDRPTNVLSFPMLSKEEILEAKVAGPELLLGDIILAHGVCEAEAVDKGMSVEVHTSHLVVHGTLHLLGYDHHGEAEAADMEAREVLALGRLGIDNPYAEVA